MEFIVTGAGRSVRFDVDPGIAAFIAALDGSKTVDELRVAATDGVDANAVLEALADEGLLEVEVIWPENGPDVRRARFLTEAVRTGTLGHVQDDPLEVFERLNGATVAIVGAGAVGGAVADSIAGAGIGSVVIIDHDIVEEANLHRQPLFRVQDAGLRKTWAAAAALKSRHPRCQVRSVDATVGDDDLLVSIGERVDFIVACADEPSVGIIAALVGDACVAAGIPHYVGGGYAYATGSIGMTVLPGQTACWRCLLATIESPLTADGVTVVRDVRRPIGALGIASSIVGAVVGWDVVRVVSGAPSLLADRVHEFDLSSLELRSRTVPRHPACACATRQAAA